MRSLVDPDSSQLSISRQCELLGLARSSYYHELVPETDLNLSLMDLIDRQYMETPFYGSRRMTWFLNQSGHSVNRKRVTRLMRLLDLEAIYPKPNVSAGDKGHKKYPYLMRDLIVDHSDQAWAADITYIPLPNGFGYLFAIMDWFSRYVIEWELSNLLDNDFCIEALERGLSQKSPEIFNTDQGVQFTSNEFTSRLQKDGIRVSMDGKGRALDNVFVERLWRSVKYEEIYPKGYESLKEVRQG